MKKLYQSLPWVLPLVLLIVVVSCSEDITDPEIENPEIPQNTNKTSGFVITGNSSSGVFAYYSEELPTETVDLSTGTDFLEFFPTSLYDAALYMQRTDGLPGFEKMVVNSEGKFESAGIIVTNDPSGVASFRIAVRDEDTGVYQDRSRPNTIVVFDPETLETIAEIDMSSVPEPIDTLESRYQRFVFRADEVFMTVRENITGLSYNGFYLQSASLASNSAIGTTHISTPVPVTTINNFGQGLVDTNGDLYFADGGQVAAGQFAQIYRVPAGSNELDPNYNFSPPFQLAPDNFFYPYMAGFKLVAPSKAIAKVNSFVPQEVIDIITTFPGNTFNEQLQAFFLDPDAVDQVLSTLFTAESAAWCEIDLISQTTTIIQGAPAHGVFAGGTIIFEHEGEIYFSLATETEQAFYKYTPGIPTATKAFDVTGGTVVGGFNLSNNN
ncbi:MAG: hypothetical protein AAF600_03085 [Bacteroidota bacterium]